MICSDTFLDYDELMEFTELQRRALESGEPVFEYKGQLYSTVLAEGLISKQLC